MIIDWNGYALGAVSADTPGLNVVERNGSRYAVWTEHSLTTEHITRVADVHPKSEAYYAGPDEYISHDPGAYPIRWYLDASELANLISLGD